MLHTLVDCTSQDRLALTCSCVVQVLQQRAASVTAAALQTPASPWEYRASNTIAVLTTLDHGTAGDVATAMDQFSSNLSCLLNNHKDVGLIEQVFILHCCVHRKRLHNKHMSCVGGADRQGCECGPAGYHVLLEQIFRRLVASALSNTDVPGRQDIRNRQRFVLLL